MTSMNMTTLRRSKKHPVLPGLLGVARVDPRSRELARRLRPGEIAVIDHLDLDQVTAQALVASGVSAIVNASPSSSGRYPNLGPGVVVGAGVILLDRVGPEILRLVEDGETLRLDGDTIFRGEVPIAAGALATRESVHAAMETARTGLRVQLESFTANAAEHLRRERDLLLDGAGIPATQTVLDGRPVLVVVAGNGWEEDVTALRHWIREVEPVLIGVDEGADALLHLGHRPDLVIGELDSVSDLALTCGAELVLHVARDGRAPALHRLEELGAEHTVFRATGTGEDLALLLADAAGATFVALAGSHTTLREFIDYGRAQMPGAFLVRLRLGSKLVDARTVAAVHRRRPAAWPLVLLMVLAVAGLVAAVTLTGLNTFDGTQLGDWWNSAYAWVQGLS
jgi:uncharacterized membrane-anchored protein